MAIKKAKASTKKPRTVKKKSASLTSAKSADKLVSKNSMPIWNVRLGLLLVAEAVAVIVAGTNKTVELTVQYLAKDALATEAAGNTVFSAATRHLVDVRVSWLVAAFLLAFGLTYLLAGTLWRSKYESWLARGVNNLRWVGFGLGGGLLVGTVAMLSGVTDVSALKLMCGSIVLASLLAAGVEMASGNRGLRRLLGLGAVLALFLSWIVFLRTTWGVLVFNGDMPNYMYYLFGSVTLFSVAVALAVYLRASKRGRMADAMYAEWAFIALGFTVSATIALQIFAGALQ